jgi:hypothetical protein
MSYKVDVYIDGLWVKTYYDVPGDSEMDAQEHIEETMALDFTVEEND